MKFPQIELPAPHSRAIYEQYRQLAAVALQMQIRGLHIDLVALKKHREAAQGRFEKFAKLWVELTGVKEIGEDGQTSEVADWFWETKGLPPIVFDKESGEPKLDNDCLLHYLNEVDDQGVNDAAAALIGYRRAAKALIMLQAYNRPKVHPEWNVTGTKGSRWTSTGPNLMNMPTHDVRYEFSYGEELLAENFKNIIVPTPGNVFIGADWSALELYLQTYIAKARVLLQWIAAGEDLHMNNARLFFGTERLPLTATKKTHKDEREVGKLGFGFSYCASDHIDTTWKQMKKKIPSITQSWTKEARLRYFGTHTDFPAWQKWTINQVQKYGFIEAGLMKRRLYLEDSMRGYNQALNAQCQIMGGDLMNSAILSLSQTLPAGCKVALSWYDCLVIDCPNDSGLIEEAKGQLVRAMEGPFPVNGLQAKFVAEASVGLNLKDA